MAYQSRFTSLIVCLLAFSLTGCLPSQELEVTKNPGLSSGEEGSASIAPSKLELHPMSDGTIHMVFRDNTKATLSHAIERSVSPASGFEELGRLPAGATSYLDISRLEANTVYYYRVKVIIPNNSKVSENDRFSFVVAIRTDESGMPSVDSALSRQLPADASPGEQFDNVLQNTTINGDVVVPDGQKWLIGPNVRIQGNLRTVAGTISMRPGSSLQFLGGDPNRYVGGGITFSSQFANDIGMWVGHLGTVDIQCTPKTSWNRTGTDSTWDPDDEYWIAPTEPEDYRVRRWTPGDPIPQVDPRVPRAEVMNVTRDCLIEGPGHIHIHAHVPQRVEYVRLENMGISNMAHGGPVEGRYAFHIHHGGDGTRGTIIRGVAAVNSGGRVFVPHGSHGITMIDNVSVNSFGEGFWWDHNRSGGEHDRTDDILVDRLKVSGVYLARSQTGNAARRSGISLAGGENIEIRNSAVSAVRDTKLANGFDWPSSGDNFGPAMWKFHNNVSHNNTGAGIRFWFNNRAPHLSHDFITYRNGSGGIETGAYSNNIQYADVLLFEDYIRHHSNTKAPEGEQPIYYNRVVVEAPEGRPAISLGRVRLAATNYNVFQDCVLRPGAGQPVMSAGHEKAATPFFIRFVRCTNGSRELIPSDIRIDHIHPDIAGSKVEIVNGDGSGWVISLDVPNQRTIVAPLP